MKIIVADDHALYRQGLISHIQECFPTAQLEAAANGQEVLSLARDFEPDIIIMDLEMPKMGGIDTINYLIGSRNNNSTTDAQHATVKVLVLSMHRNDSLMREVFSMDIHGYLLKGESENELAAAITAIDRGERFFSQSILQVMQENLRMRQYCLNNVEQLLQLTDREIQVLKLIYQEMTNGEISEHLGITQHTVELHKKGLIEKTGVKNTAGLVKFVIHCGMFN